MTSLTKISTSAGRVFLATALMLVHFAFCACPAGAAVVVEVVEPADSGCCGHEETPEPRSCCGDDECATGESDVPDENASTVPVESVSVVAPAIAFAAQTDAVAVDQASGLNPDGLKLPSHFTPSSLLFCVFTQ